MGLGGEVAVTQKLGADMWTAENTGRESIVNISKQHESTLRNSSETTLEFAGATSTTEQRKQSLDQCTEVHNLYGVLDQDETQVPALQPPGSHAFSLLEQIEEHKGPIYTMP